MCGKATNFSACPLTVLTRSLFSFVGVSFYSFRKNGPVGSDQLLPRGTAVNTCEAFIAQNNEAGCCTPNSIMQYCTDTLK